MGFTIMENFMDELKVESVLGMGTKVTMKKIINKYQKKENVDNRVVLQKENTIIDMNKVINECKI